RWRSSMKPPSMTTAGPALRSGKWRAFETARPTTRRSGPLGHRSADRAYNNLLVITELKGKNVPIKLWTRGGRVEEQALRQLHNAAALPWVAHHVAVMPDVHFGKGATVGSVIAMRGAVAPAAVGVDIGCGMAAVQTSLRAGDLPDSLKSVREALE